MLDQAIISMTQRLPNNWYGLRLAICLRRVVTMRMAKNDGIDVERWGAKMRLYPHQNICEKTALFTPQMYDTDERTELEHEVKAAIDTNRSFSFIDIGANVGLYSLFVASLAAHHANISAVEPEAISVARLRFNVSQNPWRITVKPVALGDHKGFAAIEFNNKNRGGTRTRKPVPSDIGNIVPCMSLIDVLTEEQVTAIDAMKIDVEGSEDSILLPFFREAPSSLWPRLIIAELWTDVVLTELQTRGYGVIRRTRSNYILRLTSPAA